MKESLDQLGTYEPNKEEKNDGCNTERHNWMEDIKNSKIVVIIATEGYFSKALAFAQCEYAKALKKPFRVLHHSKAEIPEGFFDGIEDIKILDVDDLDHSSLRKFRDLILEDIPDDTDEISFTGSGI